MYSQLKTNKRKWKYATKMQT